MGKYITNLAQNLIKKLKIKVAADEREFLAQNYFYFLYSEKVNAHLKQMRPETLGKIAACGKGIEGIRSYGFNFSNGHLDNYADGKSLLREIACMAIIAEMASILLLPKSVDEDKQEEKYPRARIGLGGYISRRGY